MSKGSRTNSTLAPERYSATKPLARFSSAPEICPLHFTVEWANNDVLNNVEAVLTAIHAAIKDKRVSHAPHP
ncbi:MAG: hypothetical protein WBW73_31005, partial [Rhodoplanes sp.]